VKAYYNRDNSGAVESMTSINGNVNIALLKDVPAQAKLACVPSQVVGTIRCEADISDKHGNPSGTAAMGNTLQFEALTSDGQLVVGNVYDSTKHWLSEGRYQMSVPLTTQGVWTVRLFFKTANGADVSAEFEVNVEAGAVVPSNSMFTCPATVFTSGAVKCVLQLRDQYKNDVKATNTHISDLITDVSIVPETNVFYKTIRDDQTGQIKVMIEAPATEAQLSVAVQSIASFARFGTTKSISVEQAAISPEQSKAYCSSSGTVGTMISCIVEPVTIQGVKVQSDTFGSMLDLNPGTTANVSAFEYKGQGVYFATFSPNYATTANVRISMVQGTTKQSLQTTPEGETSSIQVAIQHGEADMRHSYMSCRPVSLVATELKTSLVAGDTVQCSVFLSDSFKNSVTDSMVANFLELRAYDDLGKTKGFAQFKYGSNNEFVATMLVTTSGNLHFHSTLSYSNDPDQYASVTRVVYPGKQKMILLKMFLFCFCFVCVDVSEQWLFCFLNFHVQVKPMLDVPNLCAPRNWTFLHCHRLIVTSF